MDAAQLRKGKTESLTATKVSVQANVILDKQALKRLSHIKMS